MLTEEQAVKRAEELLQSSESTRASYEALCGLWLAYTYGNQWGGLSAGRRGGQSLQQLQTIISANRTDVRFSMNMIRPRVVKLNSRLMPKELHMRAVPASRSMADQIAALVGEARLAHHLTDTGGLRTLRIASLWRLVLGSVIVRRTMSGVGPGIAVTNADGTPSVGPNGRNRTIKRFRHDWAVCPPYEFIRDPSASTPTFDDEDCIGHEKPRTVDWLSRHYGTKIETEATMGALLEFQEFLYASTGQTLDHGWRESTAKGVMVSEWWFMDPDGDSPWPYWLLAYRNTRSPDAEDRKLKPLRFGPNPYVGLPLHHMWYDIQLLSPWGRGVPSRTIQAQDAANIAYVTFARQIISHSANKYVIEENSLCDRIENALSNRCDVPIVYKRGAAKPDRLTPGQIDPTSAEILRRTPEWLDQMLNMSPVQSGAAVARGEAARAYEVRRDAADTPITAIADDDEITLNDLLTGTLHDVAKTDTLKALEQDLGHEFSLDQLLIFKSQDTRKSLSGVQVVPDTLRPRTPDEMREDYASAVAARMVDPVTARRTMLVRGRITLDEKEARAYRRQQQEIQTILSGGRVRVPLGQDHDMHQWVVELEQESPRHAAYTDEQQDALQAHWKDHQDAKLTRQQLDAPMVQGAGQGQEAVGAEMPMEAMMGAGGMEEAGAMPPGGAEMGGPQIPEMMSPGPQLPAGIAGTIGPGAMMPGAGMAVA